MDNIVIFSQFFIMRLSIRFFFSSFYFKPTSVIAYHLPRFQRISKILWTTYRNTHTIGGPTLTCNKQSALRRQYNAENGNNPCMSWSNSPLEINSRQSWESKPGPFDQKATTLSLSQGVGIDMKFHRCELV
jgi:hypothetical protein